VSSTTGEEKWLPLAIVVQEGIGSGTQT
jgi:hypothetical protein